jgi:GH35 family endo-1,4-beta-xylanase
VNRSRFCWLPLALFLACSPAAAMTVPDLDGENSLKVSEQDAPGAVAMVSGDAVATIYADPADVQPTHIAVGLLADDVRRVAGRAPRVVGQPADLSGDAVLVGTIGHSAVIDRLIAERKIDVGKIRGRWEYYSLQVVDGPLPKVRRALVIVGSDRRGTAYGALTVSEAIGVSPWYWWADVPVARKSSLFVGPGTVTDGPVVRYRGIFLNHEAPALSGWSWEHFGGFNSKMYVHVFELLLRLKANYLWPAMWGNAFNEDDPANPKLASDYGIVMGTSDQEPLLRAQAEFDRRHPPADWNYATHPELLRQFWREGVHRNKNYESVITIGMRGRDDTPMPGGATVEQSVKLLAEIVAAQRKILAEEMNPRVEQVPQVWCLYKEVQDYYEHGLRVPDDVTLLWSDDNWGNLRRLPTPEERQRQGGAGVYYHFDYVGGPRSYKWLNTNPVAKVWEQMNLAHQYGADRIWIVNVGDLKPMEFPTEFFLTMAWDPDRWPRSRVAEFGRRWAAREFGPAHADEIAAIVAAYTRYNGRRKPELLEPGTFSLVHDNEADRVLARWQAVTAKAEEIDRDLPEDARDAFYQLVLHPARASAVVTELYVTAGRNRLYADQGRASTNDLAARARALFQTDADLSDHYNHKLAGGKWSHMMDQTHIGYTSWQEPKKNVMPEVKEIEVPAPASMGVAVEGSAFAWPGGKGEAVLPPFDAFNRQRRWVDVFNRGRTPFAFSARVSEPWIVVSAARGEVEKDQRLWVTVDWDRAPEGTADGRVTIAGPGGEPVVVEVHASNPREPDRDAGRGFVEGDGYVAVEADHYTSKTDAGAVGWKKLADHGRTSGAVTVFPVTAASVTPPKDSPSLEYRMYLFGGGNVEVEAVLSPTLNCVPGRGLRYAVSFDEQPPQVVDALARNSTSDWETAVKDGVRKVRSRHTLADRPGWHTLRFWMVDPGVVLQRLVVDRGGVKPSYLGPPESCRRIYDRGGPDAAAAVAPGTTLGQAVRGRFLIGTAVMSRQLDDPKVAALVVEQFDCLTAENEFKPENLQPQPGKFDFAAADRIVAFAQRHGMKVVGHNLCWHNQTPAWIFQDPAGRPLPRDEALRNLKNHIDAVVGHFKGKVVGWDVVNEAISDTEYEYLRDTPARRAIGDDYIAKAFELAHAADPDAELYYNDYSNENPEKREKTIRLIRELKARGVRVDAVGIQSHLLLADPEVPEVLDEAIAAYAAEGLKVVISELDVEVLPRSIFGADVAARQQEGADPYPHGLPPEVIEAQARFYRRIFRVVLKHPGVVTRVTFWGTHDGTSWLNYWPVKGRTNHPLLWDRSLQPKPAFGAVVEALISPTGRR